MTIEEQIKAAVANYSVSHKSGMNCKCISGASGHLYAEILTIIGPIKKTFVQPSSIPEHADPNLVEYTNYL